MASLLFGLVASGCREQNPAYIPLSSLDAAGGEDAPSPDTRPGDVRQAEGGRLDGSRPDTNGTADSQADVADAVAAPDGQDRGDGRGGADGRDVRGDDGQSPSDGFGDDGTPADTRRDGSRGPEVLGPDGRLDAPDDSAVVPDVPAVEAGPGVDAAGDVPSVCLNGDTRACASLANPQVGACRSGTQTCTAGVWGACIGETLPQATELCNGIDDNCNGLTDEGCASDCVVVSPTGDDATADGTPANPFATLQSAIHFALQVDGGVPRRVCVAGGVTCADSFAYQLDTQLAMTNGGLVHGNYALSTAGLTYCSGTQPPTTTIAFVAADQGVVFDQTVKSHSELGGFIITRFSPSNTGGATAAVSGVQVQGGKNVTLADIFITDAPVANTTYGVDVSAGGQVTIVGSAIGGGQGRTAAVGVHVNGGSLVLRNNCDQLVQGVCLSACDSSNGGTVGDIGLGIRGRNASTTADPAADSMAVQVSNASTSPAMVTGNTLCGGSGAASAGGTGTNVVTLQCESGSCATVAGNNITGGNGNQVTALRVAGSGTTVDGNLLSSGCGSNTATSLVLDSSSARVQNNRILGSQCAGSNGSSKFVGMQVTLGGVVGEPDVHSNTIDPMGAGTNCSSTGVSIEHASGSSTTAGIFRNNIILAGSCRTRAAISEASGAIARLVENNDLYAFAGAQTTTVLYRRANTEAETAAQVNALVGADNNISSDPKFVAYPTDLHLTTADSPCVDHGTAAGAPAHDGDGNARPAGDGFDIGAYEFVSP